MFGIRPQRRGSLRPARARAARPTLEGLEGRVLLYSATGARWAYPIRITYSIVPDGTSIGGTPSNLQQALSSKPGWQQQIEKAAAVWQAVAGINLVEVPDNGAPIGSSGNQQGDPGFGDIRIGGMPQSSGYLGFAYTPPKFNGGSNAGDILLNTAQSWQTDGTTYDLLTVAIHEFGHALGLGHSDIATADMYASYLGGNQASTSDDIQGIQSIYGPHQNGATSNNSYTSATDITPYINGYGQISLANLDINSSSGVQWYKVTVPASTTGTMTVTMQSSNLSSLSPQIQVYTASLAYLGGVAAPYSYGYTVGGSLQGVAPGQGYYIKVMAANTGPSGNGGYGLQINFGSSPQGVIPPPNTAVAAQPDQNPSSTPMGTGWEVGGLVIPWLGELPQDISAFELKLVSWGDGSGVPTSGNSLVIVGTDNNGLLHIRIFDAVGHLVTDTDETNLFGLHAVEIATLRQQLPGLLPPHVLTAAEKAEVLTDVTSILYVQTPSLNGLYRITYGSDPSHAISGFGQPELVVGDLAGHGHHPGGGQGAGGTHYDGHHGHRDAVASFGMSDTMDIPPAVDIGADPGQGSLEVLFHRRRGGPRQAEVARLQAVDAALSGWQTDGQDRGEPTVRPGSLQSLLQGGVRSRDRRAIAQAWSLSLSRDFHEPTHPTRA